MLRASLVALVLLTSPAFAQEIDIDAALVQLMNADGDEDTTVLDEETGTPDAGDADSNCPPERYGSCPELFSDEDYADWLLDNDGPTDKAYYVQWLNASDEGQDDGIPGGVQHNWDADSDPGYVDLPLPSVGDADIVGGGEQERR